MNTDNHEQLRTGFGVGDADTDDDTFRVRINPIGEGDVTLGASGERTHWSEETLRDAVTSGVLDGATIVKGTGGENPHFPLDEQVPPDHIVGRVDTWEYQSGVGPVGEADLVDEKMAAQIDAGLLEVSADLFRELGEHNADVDAKEVDAVLGMPRVTVLEKGASGSASIDTATAEALGVHPTKLAEFLQQSGDTVRWESDSGGPREPDDYRYGVVIDDLQDSEEEARLVAVYQATPDYDGWENREEENKMSEETLEVISRGGGVGGLPPVSQVMNTEQNAETVGADTPADPADETPMPNEDDDLREQLAESQSRVSDLESQKEQLAEEKSEVESELEEAEEQLSELEDENDDLERENEQLKPLKGVLAEAASGDSPLTAEQLSDRFTTTELIDAIGGDDDDDTSPVDVVREQLAESPSPRGEGGEDSEEVDSEGVEQLAAGAMNVSDMRQATTEELTNRQYIKREYDVDPAEYGTSDALRAAMRNGGDS